MYWIAQRSSGTICECTVNATGPICIYRGGRYIQVKNQFTVWPPSSTRQKFIGRSISVTLPIRIVHELEWTNQRWWWKTGVRSSCRRKTVKIIWEGKATCRLYRESQHTVIKDHVGRQEITSLPRSLVRVSSALLFLGAVLWRRRIAFLSKIILTFFAVGIRLLAYPS